MQIIMKLTDRLHRIAIIIKHLIKTKCKRIKANKINRPKILIKDKMNMKTMKFKILEKETKKMKEKIMEIWMEEKIWKEQVKWVQTSLLMEEWHSLKSKTGMIQWHMKTQIMKQKLRIWEILWSKHNLEMFLLIVRD